MEINDHRKEDVRPVSTVRLWAVATDKFMSGWGYAPDKSYVAYPIDKLKSSQYEKLMDWLENRKDFIRVRVNLYLPKGNAKCHLSIYDVPEHVIN